MSDKTALHRDAARRHELAAEHHDRAASFWDVQGDPDRADLQREMGRYERIGAELESRWAAITDPDAAVPNEMHAARLVAMQARQGAKQLTGILTRLATTLERSADLAEEQARRTEQAGQGDNAAKERYSARHAREIAQHARSQAEEWLKLT